MAFYRLAHKHHVQDLAEIVRECVTQFGVERTADNLKASSDKSGYIAQVPKTVCTFTGLRKLYLRPDARTEDHPQEVTNPVYPNPTSTAIIPGRSRFVFEDQEGSDIKTTEYYQWRVVDNSRGPTPAPRLSLSPSQDVRPRPTPVPRPTPAPRVVDNKATTKLAKRTSELKDKPENSYYLSSGCNILFICSIIIVFISLALGYYKLTTLQ